MEAIMKSFTSNILKNITTLAILLTIILVVSGCGHMDAPTASQPTTESASNMWNPQPGDQIGGMEVPLVNSTYWESIYGAAVNPATLSMSTVIGPQGGSVRFGNNRLDVPAGAVTENMTFTLTNASMTAIAVDCSPSPYVFNVPVQLSLSYAGTQYDNTPEAANLVIYYMANDGTLELMPTVVQQRAHVLVAQVNHFSRYIIGGITRTGN
jgi:hypothetical protein